MLSRADTDPADRMADEQDDDALFDRLAKSLDAVRNDAEIARSGGASGVTASVTRVEAELDRLGAAINGLTERLDVQQHAAATRDAATGRSAADMQALRQTIEAVSRRVQEQEDTIAQLTRPRRPAAGLIAIVLALVILVGAAIAAWFAFGWTMAQLTGRFTSRVSELVGIDGPRRPVPPQELAQAVAPATPVAPQTPAQNAPGQNAPAQNAPRQDTTVQIAAPPAAPEPAVAPAPNPPEAQATAAPSSTAMAGTAPVPAADPLPVPPPVPSVQPPAERPPESPPVQSARQIALRATADAWVEVRQKNGRTLLRKTLRSGETWPVPPDPTLLLTSGNPGALELVIDGVATHLTPSRGMMRDVPLDPGAITAAARPASSP